jgi:tetratricopeptide (TPR) repeat protein
LYRKQGQWDKALADHEAARQLEPHAGMPWLERALTYEAQGNWELAISQYAHAIRVDPSGPLWAARGRAYLARGQWDKAVSDFSDAIAKSPAHEYYLNRGEAYTGLGQWHKAIQDYSVVAGIPDPLTLQTHPNLHVVHAPARRNLAWILATCPDVTLRDPARALKLAKGAVKLDPTSPRAWTALGLAQYRAGDWKDAAVSFMKWQDLKVEPSGADLFFLAMTYGKLNQKDEARISFDRAAKWMEKHRPQDAELRRFRAEAAELLGIKIGP